MLGSALALISIALFGELVSAQQSAYGQCGGNNWTGATTCVSGYTCVKLNDWYSQCQPGSAATPTGGDSTTPPATTTTTSPGSGTTTGPGTTLQSGYYWIRAVASPNFHKYLQSKPLVAEGMAVIDDYTNAGQFNVVDDQLVQLISSPGQTAQFLYGNVGTERIHANKTLRVSFSKEKNTYGKFGFQGDGLTWTTPEISRPNIAAWYVCANQELFVDLGNYLSDPPSGCADQTIHYYNDAHANN